MERTPSLKKALDQDLEMQCRAAGSIMRKHFKKSLTITKKSDGSRVTNVDLAIAAWIVDHLPQYATALDLFSEETVRQPISQKKPVLIVDELDGTSHYIAKRNGFAHQTALWWPGEGLVCGVIYYPIEDILLKAWRGEEPQMVVQGVAQVMKPSIPASWEDFRHYHTKRYRGAKYRALFSRMGFSEEQLIYTHADRSRQALKGNLHSILSLMRLIQPWDWAGEKVILEALGWRYAYLDGQPLDPFVSPPPNNKGYLACPESWIDRLSSKVQEHLDQ